MKKARARITDVGGLRGTSEFVFDRGRVSTLEGSNSAGKSSVVQGLAAALSMPLDCHLEPFFEAEAVKLGIRVDRSSAKEGFVHVMSSSAQVELEFDDAVMEYAVDSKGTPLKCPDGNPGFLLAGILSNKSKVIRQLRGQDDRHEPDDFGWAVTELSLAKRYDDVLSVLKDRLERIKDIRTLAERNIRENKSLEASRKKLEQKMEETEKRISKLKREYKNVSEVLEKIEKLREQRAEWTEKHDSHLGELKSTKAQISNERKRALKYKAEAEKKLSEYELIDLELIESKMETEREESQRQVASLIKERDSLDGILNLFIVASSSMDKNKARCPLCGDGHLSVEQVENKVRELRKKKEDLNSKIGKLNLGIQQKKRELAEKKDLKKIIWEEYGDAKKKLDLIENSLRSHESIAAKIEFDVRDEKKKIEDIDSKLAKLSDKVGAGSKKAQTAYLAQEEAHSRLAEEIGGIKERLRGTDVEIEMEMYRPQTALRIAEEWYSYFNQLVEHTAKMSENQKRRAAEQFNSTIKSLLDRLGFKEFRTVMLNQDYRLYVERFDEKKKDYVFQQVRTLSTSEQMSVALILQMALKQTYLPRVPFVIIDDIMEDFDKGRREQVVQYLEEKAEENDWFVVSTKLVPELDEIRVV